MAKPVIASAVSDVPEVIAGCGWTVTPGDAGALAKQIDHVLRHPSEAEEMGRQARRKCMSQFSKAQTASRLRDVIQALP
jgi:glycosyltransferase involved in cell wall biosynthesis